MDIRATLVIGLLGCLGCNLGRAVQTNNPPRMPVADSRGRSDTSRIAKVRLDAAGKLFLNETPVSPEELKRHFSSLTEAKGEVWYYRENLGADPSPEAWATARSVLEAAAEAKLPIKLFMTPDYSVEIVPDTGTNPCSRHAEPGGGFSFCPPAGWMIAQDPELKFKTAISPRSEGQAPNITVIVVADPRPLSEWVSVAIDHYPARAKTLGAAYIKFLSRSAFTTDAGEPGFKIAFRSEKDGLTLRTTQYLFRGRGDGKLLITCTAMEKEIEAIEPACDRSIKTLLIDK